MHAYVCGRGMCVCECDIIYITHISIGYVHSRNHVSSMLNLSLYELTFTIERFGPPKLHNRFQYWTLGIFPATKHEENNFKDNRQDGTLIRTCTSRKFTIHFWQIRLTSFFIGIIRIANAKSEMTTSRYWKSRRRSKLRVWFKDSFRGRIQISF